MSLFSDAFSIPVHFEFFAIFSSLTVYILPSLSACCVTSRQHSNPPPPPHTHTVCTHWAGIMVMRKTPVDSMISSLLLTLYLYRFTTHNHLHTKVKYSTYMRPSWWANQSSVHLLYDLLARGSMTLNITFTRYEKYVHVTVMYRYLLEKDLNIVSEMKLPCPFSNFKI
jgi:hypothetical protein